MDDVLLVRRGLCVADLHAVLECFRQRQRSIHRCSVDLFHDEVIQTNVMYGADTRVIKRRDCALRARIAPRNALSKL
jgi:hypothetical protein